MYNTAMYEEIYSLQTLQGQEPVISIDMAGVSFCDGSYQIIRDHAEITVIEFVVAGQGTVNVDRSTFHPSAGDIYILQPHVRHHYYSDRQDPWVKMWFNVRGPLIPDLIDRFRLAGVNLFHAPDLREVFEEGLEIARSPELAFADKQRRIATLLFDLLYALGSRHMKGLEAEDPAPVRRVGEYIQQHLDRSVTIPEMVDVAGISRSQLNHLFKRHRGVTPYEYHLQCRIEQAADLLAHTCMRQQEIADRLGFYDAYHFSRQFKQKRGVSPREFRKASQGGG